MFTFLIFNSQFLDKSVNTIKKAHELGSDGIVYLKDLKNFWPFTLISS